MEKSHWNGKKWYAYGTSITSSQMGTYTSYLVEFSGLNVVNFGIPGGGVTNLGGFSKGELKRAVMNLDDGKQNADLITLEVGANEGGELGDKYDVGDNTFCGCLNQCIRYLQANTKAQIVVFCSIAPITAPEQSKDYYERALKIEEVCKINRVYCLGAQSGLGYVRISQDKAYTTDNIHQTKLGGYNFAQFIWAGLKNIPLWYSDEACL